MRTLPVGLSILQHEGYTMQGLGMAAAALTTVPVLILYGIFQRHIIQGVMVTGLTGRQPSAIDRVPDPDPLKNRSRVPGCAKPGDWSVGYGVVTASLASFRHRTFCRLPAARSIGLLARVPHVFGWSVESASLPIFPVCSI